ncbi:MAG: hypothetical protein V9G42_00350 [Bacteroidia bacterium]|jgi:hypothetical protein
MEIKYLEHNEIDKAKWDLCINQAINRLPYAFSWYLDVVSPNWHALVSDDYKFVFPLTWRNKMGFNYLYQPLFTQQLGIFSSLPVSFAVSNDFLNAIPSKFKLIEINLNSFNPAAGNKFVASKRLNFEMDLSLSYEEIRKFYSDNQKRNINKAKKNELKINQPDISEVISLFKNDRGLKVERMKNESFELLRRLYSALKQKGISYIRGVSDGSQTICGGIFIQTEYRIIFLFSGNTVIGKSSGAMSFLIDSVIQENSNKKIILDFEGSNDLGLARYYSSFGSIEHVYLHLKKNTLPFPVRLFKR